MSGMERNSDISLNSNRQVEFTITSWFEKSEAFVTLEELIRKKSDVYPIALRLFEYVYLTKFSSLKTSNAFLRKVYPD